MTSAANVALFAAHRMIWVTWQRAGFHRWPDAPPARDYLATRHRHLFKFRVWIEVQHNERDIEFHTFLDWLQSLYDKHILELDGKGCETISDELRGYIAFEYRDREFWIEVSEDGECGSFIRYPALEPRA